MRSQLFKARYLKIIRIIFLLIVLGVLGVWIYLPSSTKIKNLREQNSRLAKKNEDLKKEIKELQDNLRKVETDSFIWEKLARQNLGVVKEGEIVVDIKEQDE